MDELKQYNALVFIGREFIGVRANELTTLERNVLWHVNMILGHRFVVDDEGIICDTAFS